MTSYDVGQIIYVVSSKKMQVIPFVVSEEVIRKSQDYKLSDLQGDIFADIEEVRRTLVNNATTAITKICDTAKKRSSSLEAKKTHSESLGVKIPSEDDIKSFVLENGTRVNLNLPDM
jgi:hypothetical protein